MIIIEEIIKRDIRNELKEQLRNHIFRYDIDNLVNYIYDNLDKYLEIETAKDFLKFIEKFKIY